MSKSNIYNTMNGFRHYNTYNTILAHLYTFGFCYNGQVKKSTNKTIKSHLIQLERLNIIEKHELTEQQINDLKAQQGMNQANINNIKAYKWTEKAKNIFFSSRIGKFILNSVLNKIKKKYVDYKQKSLLRQKRLDNDKLEQEMYSKIHLKDVCSEELYEVLIKLSIDNCYKVNLFTRLQLKNHVRKHYIIPEQADNWEGDNRINSYKKSLYNQIEDVFDNIQDKVKELSSFSTASSVWVGTPY